MRPAGSSNLSAASPPFSDSRSDDPQSGGDYARPGASPRMIPAAMRCATRSGSGRIPRTVVRARASWTATREAPTYVAYRVPCFREIGSTPCRRIVRRRSSQSSKRLRRAVSIASRSGFRRVTVTMGTPTAEWSASTSITLNPPTAVPSRKTIARPVRYLEVPTISVMRAVASCPSTSARLVRTPSMYAGAWTTTPTMGTVSSENRKGASSIPRNRDFGFIPSHQLQVARDLVDDRVRSRPDSQTRGRSRRKLREPRVLHEGSRQSEGARLRPEGSEFFEPARPDDDLLLALRVPRGEPPPVTGLRLEGRHDGRVGDLHGEFPAGQVEILSHRDDELVLHASRAPRRAPPRASSAPPRRT